MRLGSIRWPEPVAGCSMIGLATTAVGCGALSSPQPDIAAASATAPRTQDTSLLAVGPVITASRFAAGRISAPRPRAGTRRAQR